MKAIEVAYASAPADTPIVHTLQLINPAFDGGVFYLCQGFEDLVLGLEDGSKHTFTATGLGLQLPEKSVTGREDLVFAMCNVNGFARQQMLKAKESIQETELLYRPYLENNLKLPSERPLRMHVIGYADDRQTATLSASFRNLMDRRWPSALFTPQKYPGTRYA